MVCVKISQKNKANTGSDVSLRFCKVENNDSSFYSNAHLNQLDNSQKDHSIRHRELVWNIARTTLHRFAVYCIGKYWHFTPQLQPPHVIYWKMYTWIRNGCGIRLAKSFQLNFLKNVQSTYVRQYCYHSFQLQIHERA